MGTGKSVVVGVSIAGQSEAALIDSQGHILHRCPIKTLRGRSVAATLDPYLRAIDEMLAVARAGVMRVNGIGVSLPGSVDEGARRPLAVPMLPSLNGFPLCELLETRYAFPARLLVDVDATLLGECRFGAGKGRAARRLLFLTVNAVVGAALAVDGELARPVPQCVGHISHLSVAASGPRCSCGKRGCINSLVSLDAMQKMVQRAVQRGEETSLARRLLDRAAAIPQAIAEEARRGDAVAARIYGEVNHWLSVATAQYVTLLEPDMVILGGDIVSAYDLLPAAIHTMLQANASAIATRVEVEIIPACLGRDAVLMGAAAALL